MSGETKKISLDACEQETEMERGPSERVDIIYRWNLPLESINSEHIKRPMPNANARDAAATEHQGVQAEVLTPWRSGIFWERRQNTGVTMETKLGLHQSNPSATTR